MFKHKNYFDTGRSRRSSLIEPDPRILSDASEVVVNLGELYSKDPSTMTMTVDKEDDDAYSSISRPQKNVLSATGAHRHQRPASQLA